MLSTWVNVYFLILMTLDKTLQAYSKGSNPSQCSCYTIGWRPNSWSYGRQQCRTQRGDLVSMETYEEWQFIKTQIQNRTVYNDEWWIGLVKRDGRWKWMSNQPLTYNLWQPGEPRGGVNDTCVLIAKNYPKDTYGLFDDAKCDVLRGWICEYKMQTACSYDEVQWCYNPVTPTVMRVSKTEPEVTTTTTTTTTDFATSTWMRQTTTKETTNFPSPTTTSIKDTFDHPASTKYPIPTTQHQNYTEMIKTVRTDNSRLTTPVSQSTKKPFSTLVIIIAVLAVSVVVCICGWKLKRKEKLKSRPKHDDTSTEHNTSDVIAGSSSGMQNEHELKAIVIQPNNACVQEDSHATMHDNASYNSTDTKEVAKSSHSCLVPQIVHDALAVGNHSNMTSLEPTGKEFPPSKASQENTELTPGDTESKENSNVQSSAIYATVDKSKKKNKTTEVVYAQVKKRNTNPVDQHKNLFTYAKVAELDHDTTRSIPQTPPTYHPPEYANVSTMLARSLRCQTK